MRLGTIATVIRGEGVMSAVRRAGERIEEGGRDVALRVRGAFARPEEAPILNVCATRVVPRLGGVQVQLGLRLEAERTLRRVALLHAGTLEFASHSRRVPGDFETAVRRAIDLTGARAIHLEGTDGVPVEALLRLARDTRLILGIHDLTLASREALEAASGVVFPSRFLLDRYGELENAVVIEPGVAGVRGGGGRAVAYAGSVKRHKGAHLLPDILRDGAHVFGGGDEDLLRALRRIATVHGYYRRGELPSLLARHGVGLVVVPSIVPESFGLVVSEAWLAGAAVAAFDHGAIADRIRAHGGGWLAPLESGAAGLASIVDAWIAGEITSSGAADSVRSPMDAAREMVAWYRTAACD